MTKKPIVIIGAGGFAQEVLSTINDINRSAQENWQIIGFMSELESDWCRKTFHGIPILRPAEAMKIPNAFIAVGNPKLKEYFFLEYPYFEYPNIIHPSVHFADWVELDDRGIIVQANSSLLASCQIKQFVHINAHVCIGHDAVIGKFSTVSPGAMIMGNCKVGEKSYIGVGSSFREKVIVGNECVIGAGAAVVSNIPEKTMALGVPAKIKKGL
jgi:sugar O-acyltransferase (sialic acid O-acetyltransferase NeuD family)